MIDIFTFRLSNYSSRNPNNLNHFRPYQVTFGSKSLKDTGYQIWNCLPNVLKSAKNLHSFKNYLKKWDGRTYKNVMLVNTMSLNLHIIFSSSYNGARFIYLSSMNLSMFDLG